MSCCTDGKCPECQKNKVMVVDPDKPTAIPSVLTNTMVVHSCPEVIPRPNFKKVVATLDGVEYWKPRKEDLLAIVQGKLDVKSSQSCKKCYGRGYTAFVHGTTTKILCKCVMVGNKKGSEG